MQSYSVVLTQKKFITPKVIELRFEKPARFSFVSGEYIQIKVPDGAQSVFRAYSIASVPKDTELVFCIKIVNEGLATTYLSRLEKGDRLELRGPGGDFRWLAGAPGYWYVAASVGIAPLLSMIRHQLEDLKSSEPVYLLFGVRSEADIFWIDELDQLVKQFSQFSYSVTLSEPSADWRGLKGRVTDHLDRAPHAYHFYLCGAGGMVNDVRMLLQSLGVSPKQIQVELF